PPSSAGAWAASRAAEPTAAARTASQAARAGAIGRLVSTCQALGWGGVAGRTVRQASAPPAGGGRLRRGRGGAEAGAGPARADRAVRIKVARRVHERRRDGAGRPRHASGRVARVELDVAGDVALAAEAQRLCLLVAQRVLGLHLRADEVVVVDA